MIYLDTSAFIKLYLREDGSSEVHDLVVSQHEPLPIWHFIELEFLNALRFKVFLVEMSTDDVERVISLYLDRKRNGQYFAPRLDPIALHELSLQMTIRTQTIGCRALDILHVAAARLCEATMFVTADKRQAKLAEVEGRVVKLISSLLTAP
jgi:predicted nucleic acid-binding protein